MDIQLLLCINNASGLPSGAIIKLDVELADDPLALELESKFFPETACVCRVTKTHVRLGERTYPITSHGTWVGNIFWDAVGMSVETANALLNYARDLNVFSVDGGWSALCDMWNDLSQPIDLAQVMTK